MKTDTFLFRLALSIAVLWLGYWGYQSITQYNAAKASALAYRMDPSRYERCNDATLDASSKMDAWKWRAPTFKEVDDCRRMYDRIKDDFAARQSLWDNLINERNAVSSFFYYGLLPAGIVLLILGLWDWIAATFLYYLNWLRTGKTKVGGD